ncbi:hypothetical protein SAMN04487886_11712 [Clostridium sp. DSM 8431]|uniref:hypothetical protein n=1 Tax=Clostridium sp. DSM 8431 TaxID=1761781 RepID=UPI0008E83501|nr:hypothetical protein [Clostridium sp. DSM 8431]SFU79903.1 hypothetical protein SAMN04487886_11712 [Clostridium sp. DSM 8431]
MKYYIVALFDDDSYEIINPIQKNLSRKFKGNRHSPQPYIALNVLDNPNMEKLCAVLEKTIKPYKKFKVELCDDVMINENMKTVNLKILNEGYITKISRSLKETLNLHGIYSKSHQDTPLSISLANLTYFNKDNKRYKNDMTCDIVKNSDKSITLKVSKFEIWKVSNSKRETCLKSYTLKTF